MLLYPHTPTSTPDTTLTTDNIRTMLTELSPYSPLRTESPTNHTPTPTVNAMDAAITAQTNSIDGVELEGDFFSYCDNLIDERDDLCYWLIFVLLMRVRLNLFYIDY